MFVLATALAADPAVIPGGLFDADSLVVDPAGTTHALVSPKKTRLAAVTNQLTFTNDQGEVIGRVGGDPVRYVRVAPGGEPEVVPVPGPSGEWREGENVEDAALVLGSDGPVVLVTGQSCGQTCVPAAWIARWTGSGFETRDWDRGPGVHSGLLTGVGPDGRWFAVSHVTGGEGGFTGFQRTDEDGAVRPWVPAPRGSPEAVVDGAPLRLLYRSGKELHLSDGTEDVVVADGARHHADAVADGRGEVRFLMYDADRKRLRSGTPASGPDDVDTPESGWHHALTVAGGQPLAAWYYYRNNYNKGVKVGAWTGDRWDQWTQVRSDTRNIGWNVDLAAGPDGRTALIGLDRSRQEVVLHTWPSVDAMRAEGVPDAGDWTDRRRNAFFFAYGGGWYQWWNITANAPSEETFTFSGVEPVTGSYGVTPGLGLEGGFAGKFGPFDLALEYLRRSGDDEATQTIQRLQNLMGKIGIEDLPLPDSELQLHLRVSDLDAAYRSTTGAASAFTTAERLVEARYVGKQGYHFGLRYHGFEGPLDVFESTNQLVTGRFVADARFKTASVVGGWSVMDYLKKYEVRFLGPYLDAQLAGGFANAALLDPSGRPGSNASGLTITANADLGVAAYQRVRSLGGTGGFARLGMRGWYQFTGNQEPEETATTTTTTGTGTEAPEAFRNFSRTDTRFGPYAHVGVVF